MRDYENGWSGLRGFAASHGVCDAHDSDDVAANKIKAVIQGTLPEDSVEETPEKPSGLFDRGGDDG